MSVFLKPVESDDDSQILSFEADTVRIGRQRDNDLSVDPAKHPSVSGYHAELYRDGGTVFIRDLQSRNGTFVNNRKITQAVALKDGDLLQFSARGPKFIFTTKDAAAPDDGSAHADAGSPTLISPREAPVKPPEKPGLQRRLGRLLPAVLAIAALLVFGGIGFFLGIALWQLLIAAALLVLVGGAGYVGWRFWKRRKKAQEASEAAEEESQATVRDTAEAANLHVIRTKWAEVLRSLKDSKLQQAGDEPIYAFPWFLLLGEPSSGKSALVKAGAPLSSVVTSKREGPTDNCDWFFCDKAVVLDTGGKYVFQSKESAAAREWQELLRLLRVNRRREPLNGVIVTLPADALISRPLDKLKEQAAHIRERLDEIVQRLGVRIPVYLTVTKCDLIDGFSELFSALPEGARLQALGCVNTEALKESDAGRALERLLRIIVERLERLRLAVFYGDEENSHSRGSYIFPAELKTLETPLRGFLDVLFRASPYREVPFFRGLFLTSARESGAPASRLARLLGISFSAAAGQRIAARDYFVRDLFSAVFPNDRSLAGRTADTRERFSLSRAAGVTLAAAASLLICAAFTLSFTNNWLALARLDASACAGAGSQAASFAQRLRPLDECRASIESVSPRGLWNRISRDFGLGHAARVGGVLRERYIGEFRAGILAAVDGRIDNGLAADDADALMISLLLQRLRLFAACRENGRCSPGETGNGLSYRTMLAVAQSASAEGDPNVERLQRTHEAFLLWQDHPAVFDEMYAKDLQRVKSWAARGNLTEEWVLKSARSQFEPVRAADFWGGAIPLEVEGAYTARAWKEGIAPLISGLESIASDRDFGSAIKSFHETYRRRALAQWENFLARFSEGESSVSSLSTTRDFGATILSADSPYFRVIETAHKNLSVLLADASQRKDLESWAATLKSYAELKAKLQSALDEAKGAKAGDAAQPDQLALKSLAMYLDAVNEFRADFAAADRCLKSAQKAFQEPELSNKATHPLLKATYAARVLRDSLGSPAGDDALFWNLLERPLALAWRAMLAESGRQLQEHWYRLRLGIRNQPDPGIAGEKIYGFASDGPAGPFLTQSGRRAPRTLLGQKIQFTDAFLSYLARLRADAITSPLTQTAPPAEPPAYIVVVR